MKTWQKKIIKLKNIKRWKYQAWCYVPWAVSFCIIHYCPAAEWKICSIKCFLWRYRYRQTIQCKMNFLRRRQRRVYAFDFSLFYVCKSKNRNSDHFLLRQLRPKFCNHIFSCPWSLKPSKSCKGTKRGGSWNSAFVISCGNETKQKAPGYRCSLEFNAYWNRSSWNGIQWSWNMEQEHTRWMRLFPFNMNSRKVPSIGHSNRWVKIFAKSPVMRGAVMVKIIISIFGVCMDIIHHYQNSCKLTFWFKFHC